MAQGFGDLPSNPSREEPLEAEIVEEPAIAPNRAVSPYPPQKSRPRRSIKRLLVIGVAVCLGLVLVCGGLGFVVYRAGMQLAGLNPPANLPPDRPLTEDRAAILATLDGTWHVASDDDQHREVRRLLRRLEQASESDDRQAFGKLVDWPAHMDRFYRAYRFPDVNVVMRLSLLGVERGQFTMPEDASDFKIASVREMDEDNLFVYTYAQQGEMADYPFLFHMRRQNGEWKLVDWADMSILWWRAAHHGITSGPLSGDRAGDQQRQVIDSISQADSLREDEQIRDAEAALRQAEGTTGVAQLRDSNLYYIAIRWNAMGNSAQAERVLRQIGNPDGTPMSHYVLAQIHAGNGKHAEAVAALERYEQCAGFHADVVTLKLASHVALAQKDLAAKCALSLLRYDPVDESALRLALEHVAPDKLADVFSLLPSEAAQADRLVGAAHTLLFRDAIPAYQKVRDFVAEKFPQTNFARQMDAELRHYEGELDQAAALFKEMYEAEMDPDKRQTLQQEYLTIMLQSHPPETIYQATANPRETIAAFTKEVEYGDEAMIEMHELAPLLALHRERDPSDPKIPWYAALVAYDKGDWSTVVTEATKALQAAHAAEGEQPENAAIRNRLVEARYRLGQGLEAYRDAADKPLAYRWLAEYMVGAGDWDTLRLLNELHPEMPADGWRRYYGLQVREHDAKASQNHLELAAVRQGYKDLLQSNPNNQVYPGMVTAQMDNLGIAGADWRTYVESHDDPAMLFTRLAGRFKRENDFTALDELMALARRKFPDHAVLRQYELSELWNNEDYAAIIRRFAPTGNERQGRFGAYQLSQVNNRLLLSYLIEGDTAKAWELASKPDPNFQQQWLVRLAEGNVENVRQFLSEHGDEIYSPLSLTEDAARVPAIVRFLESESFHGLRREVPLDWSISYASTKAVAFYNSPVECTAEALRQRLQRSGLQDVRVEKLGPPVVSNSFRIVTASATCFLTCETTPYITADELSKQGIYLSPALKASLGAHQQWIALDWVRGSPAASKQDWPRLIAAMLPSAAAVWYQSPDVSARHILLSPEKEQQLLADPQKLLADADNSSATGWLPHSADTETLPHVRRWYQRLRAAAQGEKRGKIQVRFRQGHIVEEYMLEVMAVKHEHWGHYVIESRLPATSVVNPFFVKDDLVRIEPDMVRSWED